MGLLDAVVGALGGTGGAGGPDWMGLISGVLANGSAHGGLGGLLQQLQAGGLGAHADSWVGTGANLPVSGDQLSAALGGAGGLIGQLAQQAGVSHGQASDMLAQLLPQVINHLTPAGQVPQGGLGGAADIMGMLGGLLGAR
jgi:uncharacterized protein YidB (DUF937 family)